MRYTKTQRYFRLITAKILVILEIKKVKMLQFIKHMVKTSLLVTVGGVSFVFSLVLGFFLVLLVFAVIAVGAQSSGANDSERKVIHTSGEGKEVLASVPVNGLILGERGELGLFDELALGQVVYGYEVKEMLYTLAEDKKVKGVVLEINSPGGTIYGSQAIADGMKHYSEKTGNPVLSYTGSMAASGGYWAALNADEIWADHGTMIGSIGVIVGPFVFYDEVMADEMYNTKNGISISYITAGENKDIGNPFRPLSEKELSVLQRGAEDNYKIFVELVAKNRDISEEKIIKEVGALPYGEIQAKELGLIDEVGNKQDSYNRLADLAKVPGNYQVEQVKFQGSSFDSLFGVAMARLSGYSASSQSRQTSAKPQFCVVPGSLAYAGNSLEDICR